MFYCSLLSSTFLLIGLQVNMKKVKMKLHFQAPGTRDCRNIADLIEPMTPCNKTQVGGCYAVSSPLHLTVPAAKSENHVTAPQHLQEMCCNFVAVEETFVELKTILVFIGIFYFIFVSPIK